MDYFNKVRSRAKAFGGALFSTIQIAPVATPKMRPITVIMDFIDTQDLRNFLGVWQLKLTHLAFTKRRFANQLLNWSSTTARIKPRVR